MSNPPKHATKVLAAIAQCPGLTARRIAEVTGLTLHVVYNTVGWLAAHGDIERIAGWPAGFSPTTMGEAQHDALTECTDLLAAVEGLIAEAMQAPGWDATPGDVKHKIEHAWVELTRDR